MVLLVVVALICYIASAMNAKNLYDEYIILGMDEAQYVNTIKNIIELVYAPKVRISMGQITDIISVYMTDEVVDQFLRGDQDAMIGPSTTDITVHDIRLFYGHHQDNRTSKILAAFKVVDDRRHWDIILEMWLGSDGIIYDIMPHQGGIVL